MIFLPTRITRLYGSNEETQTLDTIGYQLVPNLMWGERHLCLSRLIDYPEDVFLSFLKEVSIGKHLNPTWNALE